MNELIVQSGKYRKQGIGIVKGSKVEHLAPPYENVPFLMKDLFSYLKTNEIELITSVSGAGKQVAINTIVATQGFTKFDNPRKFACHAGVAPFNYSSGYSLKSKWKVSHRANKKLKKLFHMTALSAIQAPGELRDYYLRK